MKRILFVMTSLKTGGIATALENLLFELDKNKNQKTNIDLILFDISPDIIKILPKSINIIKMHWLASLITISNKEAFRKSLKIGVAKLILGSFVRLFGDKFIYNFIFGFCKKTNYYDVAISYTQSAPKHRFYGGCNEYVNKFVDAGKKITFVHCDFEKYGLANNHSMDIYKKFDYIACVSEGVKRGFCTSFPSLSKRTVVVKNCQNYNKIIELSKEKVDNFDSNYIQIVTVARIAKEKGHYRMLNVLNKIINVNKKTNLHWHIIGDGDDKSKNELIKTIEAFNLQKFITLHGNQNNPYKYIKNADLLLIPSYHEAAPMVISEALILGVPILTTRTISAYEMVEQPKFGFVCDNSENGLYESINSIVNDTDCLLFYKNRINLYYKCDNRDAVSQFYKIIN